MTMGMMMMNDDWWKVTKIRAQQHAGNLATSPDEAIAVEASRILRKRDGKETRMMPIHDALFCFLALMYWYGGILDVLNNEGYTLLVMSPFVTLLCAFMVWRKHAGIREADDTMYDWAEEYRRSAADWKLQRNQEAKNHQPMGKYPPEE